MGKQSPAIDMAMEYINERISSGVWKPAERLPGIRTLCTMAGVSLVTMWKAVDTLRTRGVLHVIHGQGIRIASPDRDQDSAVSDSSTGAAIPQGALRNRKWDVLRTHLQRDIVNAVYHPGATLPSIKEMANTYGVSFQTLKRALDALVLDEVIIPYKRMFLIPSLTARRTGATIVVLTRGEPRGDLNSWTPWGEEYLRFLERECSRLQINLETFIYTMDNGRIVFTKKDGEVIRDLKFGDAPIGYLLRCISEDESYLEILRRIVPFGRPIAISDEGSNLRLPPVFAGNPNIRIFALAVSGQLVARYLLELGHRKVAYISPFHHASWSHNRCRELNNTFEASGFKGNIMELTLDEDPFPLGFRKNIHPDHEMLREFIDKNIDHHQVDIVKNIVDRAETSIRNIIEEEELRACTAPLFDRALADGSITAWVLVNDRIALFALEHLRSKGKETEISIISFDDTFEAYAHEIASFNFNINALAQAMLSWVVNPRHQPIPGDRRQVEIGGMVILRKSVKKVG